MTKSPSNTQKIQPHKPYNLQSSNNPRLGRTFDMNYFNETHQNQIPKQNLSLTLQPRRTTQSFDLLEKNQNSPYLDPVECFGNYPPPSPPSLIKSRTSPYLTQPVRPSKISPPSTPRSPRKYIHTEKDDFPYQKRAQWQEQSESMFFNQVNQKHQQQKQKCSKIYSTDFLRQRQLSIKRVTTARQKKEMEDRRQRLRECKEYQRSVQDEERRQRFYNDEIYCRTGKQYRYIPNYDRSNPNNDGHIYI